MLVVGRTGTAREFEWATSCAASAPAVARCLEPLQYPNIHLPLAFMQTINRFLYGPTPEDRVRAWQSKLRQESRVLDREMRQVRSLSTNDGTLALTIMFSWTLKRIRYGKLSSNLPRRGITSRRGFWRVRSCEVTSRRIDSQ
jgi:hypothetical protein